jgi:hypothetical protein
MPSGTAGPRNMTGNLPPLWKTQREAGTGLQKAVRGSHSTQAGRVRRVSTPKDSNEQN